jgi:hypothetical protein
VNAHVSLGQTRLAVANAVKVLQDEIDRLRGLQAAASRREEAERELRSENARLVADARRRDRAVAAQRQTKIAVDRKWFEALVADALSGLSELAIEARRAGKQARADQIGRRADALSRDVSELQKRDRSDSDV